ncbi:MAG: DUF456 family protein [Phycisphaeraceae bacterium]|nr:DUF456 family protein [Phycisphaeraceae bacterium]
MLWFALFSLLLAGLVGFVLTLLTLPGIWLPIAVALLFQWFSPGMFPWWVIIVALLLGVLAEILELVASAAGAAKAGGTKRAAAGAIVGTIAGALIGSLILFFPVGTIIGAIAGAGIGASLMDRSRANRTWRDCANVGAGAAAARGVAIVLKGAFGAAIALLLMIGAVSQAL